MSSNSVLRTHNTFRTSKPTEDVKCKFVEFVLWPEVITISSLQCNLEQQFWSNSSVFKHNIHCSISAINWDGVHLREAFTQILLLAEAGSTIFVHNLYIIG